MVPGAEVEAYVSGKTIRNTTEPAIALRRIGGRAYIERNVLSTSSVVVWVSNSSSSGSDWELDEAPAVGDPPRMAEIGNGDRASIGERQWRMTFQGRMAARPVVVGLELGQLPFQVTGIPERDMVEKFSPDRPDEPLDERV